MNNEKTIQQIKNLRIQPIGSFALSDTHAAQNKMLDKVLAILEAQQCWQPISTAPKDGTEVSLYWHYFYKDDKDRTHGVTVGYWDNGKWHCDDETPNCITHWMPLPSTDHIKETLEEA